jgi:hypothetical protein
MRYRKLSARPRHHGQAEGAIEEFKKSLPETLAKIARGFCQGSRQSV